jgi:hypothetical protein
MHNGCKFIQQKMKLSCSFQNFIHEAYLQICTSQHISTKKEERMYRNSSQQANVLFTSARIYMVVRMYILANHQENQVQNCNFTSSTTLGTIEILRFNAAAAQSKTPTKTASPPKIGIFSISLQINKEQLSLISTTSQTKCLTMSDQKRY